MKTSLLLLAALLAFGCLFDSGKGKGSPSFVGEWHAHREDAFTLGDSLSDDSLKRYFLAGGIDVDSIMWGGSGYTYDTAQFNFLLTTFEWNCPAGIACSEILWTSSSRRKFTEDSMTRFSLKNQVVVDSYTVAYSFSADSLFLHLLEDYHIAQLYEFRGGGDTLRIWYQLDSLELAAETLVRQR